MLTISLIAINLFIIFLVMAAPLGVRSFALRLHVDAPREALWQAIWPFGSNARWSGEIVDVEPVGAGGNRAEIALAWPGRDGNPIRRVVEFADVRPGEGFAMRVVDDSSLDGAFWQHYRQSHELADHPQGGTVVVRRTTDRYRGLAFMVFRYFAARREMRKLRTWAETGRYKRGGIFEHPMTQIAMASLSALILWPLFGLTGTGFLMSATLTAVIAMHEFGHMIAFRMMGHRSARMIFIPILGGVAIGGRPYDTRYEIAFVALMGAGFSAFAIPVGIWGHALALSQGHAVMAALLGGYAACTAFFNIANLAPVWRFDGGQILRQIIAGSAMRALGAFGLGSAILGFGWLADLPTSMLLAAAVVLCVLGLMTSGTGAKPRADMKPSTGRERLLIACGLAAVYVIHGSGVVWAMTVYL